MFSHLYPSKVFVWLSVMAIAGIAIGSVIQVPVWFVVVLIGASVVVFAVISHAITRFMCACVLCMVLGIMRVDTAHRPTEFAGMYDTKQELHGMVIEDPDTRTDKQLLTVKPTESGQYILVTATLAQQYAYGDEVIIEGKVTEPKQFDDFDYASYLKRYSVYGLMRYPHIMVLRDHQGNAAISSLLAVKHWFMGRLDRVYEEPFRSLVLGILIGARKTLPQDVTESFTATGLSHIIAVSGYNITIIISSLGFLSYWVGRKWSYWLLCGLILSFVVIAGASASVVRAAVMGMLVLTSLQVGRKYTVTPSLCAAALVMLLANPLILMYDIGFQLSFMATMGIVYGLPLLQTLTERWPSLWGVTEILLGTFAAILCTLPLILFHFGRLSIIAPVANILVLPVVPSVMLFGALSVLPVVGPGCALVAHGLMVVVLSVVSYLSHLPWSVVDLHIGALVFWILMALLLILYYALGRFAQSQMKPNAEPVERV